MFSLLTKIFGTVNDRIIKKLYSEIEKINNFEPKISGLSDIELRNKTIEFKTRLTNGELLENIKYEAFAVTREAAKRVLGLRHFDVQLIGGLILNNGQITEMRTGEGKTLVATLPAYLNALSGKGVHIVTVNDYLAKRDAQWMGKIYQFLGLSVGYIVGQISDEQRRYAYNCDITYATNNELGFDFLRDNMKYSKESRVMRPFNYAIVDEVDSILIDEARTPLIISGPVDDNSDLYVSVSELIKKLQVDDYEKDEKTRSINLTDKGIARIEEFMIANKLIKANTGLYDFENLTLVHYVMQALKAHNLFRKDVDYIVKQGKVQIIDEFSGRIMEGRRYSDGLHQSIEAKEKVPVQNENQTLASLTFQNYFRMYPKLSGMTGTAMTEAIELKDIYNLDVISVPTHHPVKRIDHDDEVYGTKQEKYDAIVKLIKDCYQREQPVLVGTINIEKSEELSEILKQHNISHNILNAKFHEQEAYIIAQAGRPKTVTIATNMAGRGTDIMLGGNAEMLLMELQQKNLSQEAHAKQVKEITDQIALDKQKVIDAGGLYVIATERHESRRIDNQLRGRSGRQGDPGSTKFFLALDDDLMRIFASERVSDILRTLGLKNGEAIRHPMISRSLEKAQQKVEAHNFEIRKNLLKFDDVMNQQRKVIYEQRDYIISTDINNEFIFDIIKEVLSNTVNIFIPPKSYREDWALEGLKSEIERIFALKFSFEFVQAEDVTEIEIFDRLLKIIQDNYNNKNAVYGWELMANAIKYIFVTTLDQIWKDHLHSLDHLRQGIFLRAYGQKDPLIEYKKEAFELFTKMLDSLYPLCVQKLCHLNIDTEHLDSKALSLSNKTLQKMKETREDPALDNKYHSGVSLATKLIPQKAYITPENRVANDENTWGKVARNETCPCGSEKKYKYCHGKA